ncbi:MAG TPA: YetF domain-containing protein [Mycobacteriales bacterium]
MEPTVWRRARPERAGWCATMARMWSEVFHLGVPVGEKAVRALLIYAFLVIALRLAGKRELAQLNTVDFVVLLAVANAVQNGLIGNDNSVTGAVVGASVLFAINGVVALLLFRVVRFRRLVEGSATTLVLDGVVDHRALHRERLSLDDLLDRVQEAGADGFANVQRASLEPSGRILVIPKKSTESQREYQDLRRRLDELTELVRRQGDEPAAS